LIGLIPASKLIELRFFFDSYSDVLATFNSLGGLHLEHDETETVTNENLYIPFAQSSRGQLLRKSFDRRMAALWQSVERAHIYQSRSRELLPRE
jgi:hypothetical protein